MNDKILNIEILRTSAAIACSALSSIINLEVKFSELNGDHRKALRELRQILWDEIDINRRDLKDYENLLKLNTSLVNAMMIATRDLCIKSNKIDKLNNQLSFSTYRFNYFKWLDRLIVRADKFLKRMAIRLRKK